MYHRTASHSLTTVPAHARFAASLALIATACASATDDPVANTDLDGDHPSAASRTVTPDPLYGARFTFDPAIGAPECTESSLLSALRSDRQYTWEHGLLSKLSVYWMSVPAQCTKRFSIALNTDYVTCVFDESNGVLTADGSRRHHGEMVTFYCADQTTRITQAVPGPSIAGDTSLLKLLSGGWVDERAGVPYNDCYAATLPDGRKISNGWAECFRGGTPLRRTGDALVAVSFADYNQQAYRFAIFEADRTFAECTSSTCIYYRPH